MEVSGFNPGAGGNICQWQEFGHNFQQWKLEGLDRGNACRVVNRGSGLVLEVVNSSTSYSANIAQWYWNGGSQQVWRFDGR